MLGWCRPECCSCSSTGRGWPRHLYTVEFGYSYSIGSVHLVICAVSSLGWPQLGHTLLTPALCRERYLLQLLKSKMCLVVQSWKVLGNLFITLCMSFQWISSKAHMVGLCLAFQTVPWPSYSAPVSVHGFRHCWLDLDRVYWDHNIFIWKGC